MSGAWTPGPWRAVVDWPDRPVLFDTDDVLTAAGDPVCRMQGNVERAYADSRLIAAAPDMAAALEPYAKDPCECNLVATQRPESVDPCRSCAARSALAKARGEDTDTEEKS